MIRRLPEKHISASLWGARYQDITTTQIHPRAPAASLLLDSPENSAHEQPLVLPQVIHR
jgi:hypothetical protein